MFKAGDPPARGPFDDLREEGSARNAAFHAALRRHQRKHREGFGARSLRQRHARLQFAQLVRSVSLPMYWRSARLTAARRPGSALRQAVAQRMATLRHLAATPSWRRLAQGVALAGACTLAAASTLMVKGWVQNDPSWVLQRLDERLGSAILDRHHTLLGGVFPHIVSAASGQPVDHQAFGYVHATQPVPPLFTAMLLEAEHKQHFSQWRNLCGNDWLGKLGGLVASGRGASTFAEQTARYLVAPENERANAGVKARIQKLESYGIACAVDTALGGAPGVLANYQETAAFAQIGGSTRGFEAMLAVLFGVAPAQATPAQLAILAALPQRNISAVPAEAFAAGCEPLRKLTPAELQQADATTRHARSQCKMLGRARVLLERTVPDGPVLEQALADIATIEHTGLQPVDRFVALPSRRLVNLSLRAHTLLGPEIVSLVAREADASEIPKGSPLTLSLDADEQLAFRGAAEEALKTVDRSTAAREQLCVTLHADSAPRHCRNAPEGFAQADVVLLRARVEDGGITRLFHSSPAAYERPTQAGSIAKLVIVAAALARGYTPDTPVCPRAAKDGQRPLRREHRTAPYGYARCAGHEIPLREAMATSDSLAFYDLARTLGDDALRQAAQALSLPVRDDLKAYPAFTLAFGTLLVTPGQMLAMGQAVMALAYGLPVHAAAPRLLAGANAPPSAWQGLSRLLPDGMQRAQLRQLVEAPVSHARGTLHALQAHSTATAGKSGTTSNRKSPYPGSRPYVQGKLALTYQPADKTVALALIAGPGAHPLSQPAMPTEVLNPVRLALLK